MNILNLIEKKQIILFFGFLLFGCGNIGVSTGGSTAPNDARPTTTQISQGQLAGQNGKTVSGSALIFQGSASGSFILRLEGITTPQEQALTIKIYANPSGLVATFQLRSTTGNQNYSFTNSDTGVNFTSVYIFSTQNNQNYGTAQFVTSP